MGLCAGLAIVLAGQTALAAETGAAEASIPPGPSEVCVPARIPFDAEGLHLTGMWSSDETIYYVRHAGDKVWFSAMSDFAQQRGEIGRELSSVGMGSLDGTELIVDVAEVPRGDVWNAGEVTVTVGPDANGNLEARSVAEDGTTTVITPCEPTRRQVGWFARPFSYTVPFGLAVWDAPGTTDLQVLQTPDLPGNGISFWVLGPSWETTCSTPAEVSIPTDVTPATLEAHLRAIPELAVGEASTATLAGQPATVLDVTTTPGAAGCGGDGYVRMFKESGYESGLATGQAARLILLDAGDATFVIEVWGQDLDAWVPIAQQIVDSVQLDMPAA
jgi:hypothetical protein